MNPELVHIIVIVSKEPIEIRPGQYDVGKKLMEVRTQGLHNTDMVLRKAVYDFTTRHLGP